MKPFLLKWELEGAHKIVSDFFHYHANHNFSLGDIAKFISQISIFSRALATCPKKTNILVQEMKTRFLFIWSYLGWLKRETQIILSNAILNALLSELSKKYGDPTESKVLIKWSEFLQDWNNAYSRAMGQTQNL